MCRQNYIACVNWKRALARASSILLWWYMPYVFPLLHKASFLMINQGYLNHLPRTEAAILRKWAGYGTTKNSLRHLLW